MVALPKERNKRRTERAKGGEEEEEEVNERERERERESSKSILPDEQGQKRGGNQRGEKRSLAAPKLKFIGFCVGRPKNWIRPNKATCRPAAGFRLPKNQEKDHIFNDWPRPFQYLTART